MAGIPRCYYVAHAGHRMWIAEEVCGGRVPMGRSSVAGPISVFDGVGDRGLGGGAFPGGFSSWPGMGSLGGERSLS